MLEQPLVAILEHLLVDVVTNLVEHIDLLRCRHRVVDREHRSWAASGVVVAEGHLDRHTGLACEVDDIVSNLKDKTIEDVIGEQIRKQCKGE